MFGGIGGFRLGIERADERFKCVGYYDWDKSAVAVYNKRFGETHSPTDITKLDSNEIPEFDLICAGFPCQAFSMAGKRMGFDDTRGTLFFEIARIVKERRPQYLFFENVKGLLSHDNGRTFAVILSTLDELGYNVEWEMLNSKYFGVPQNRERVFIIGHNRGKPSGKIFPIGEINEQFIETQNKAQTNGTWIRCSNTLSQSPHGGIPGETIIANTLSHRYYKDGSENLIGVRPILTPEREKKRQHGRRMKENGEEMFTLTGQDIHGVVYENRIRKLTPIECERLQGFPDNWTGGVSDSQRYKLLGNAVTTNVIRAIAEKMSEMWLVPGHKRVPEDRVNDLDMA